MTAPPELRTFTVVLPAAAHEMVQEEVGKQIRHLARDITNVRFGEEGRRLLFDAPAGHDGDLLRRAEALALRVQRGLRSLERTVVYRTAAADRPRFAAVGTAPGVHPTGPGQVALRGLSLRLYRYFDGLFARLGRRWRAEDLLTPTLIPSTVLARCDYFRSFPQSVTFACHLGEDGERIEGFRARHAGRDDIDAAALGDMDPPEACLSPAVCYHVYALNAGVTVPAGGLAYGVCGKCFRYESTNLSDLRRLWDFTMREIVFLGSRDVVLKARGHATEAMAALLEAHALAGEIRTASDPFFIAPDAVAKTYFQLSSETKHEISLMLPDGERVAAGSLNYHTDFFGRAFDTRVADGGAMHSVCVAFGLERWVHAFVAQHGTAVGDWPAVVRDSVEITEGDGQL